MPVLSVKEERPDRCRSIKDIHGRDVWVFQAGRSEDFDWLERQIVENGYYEKPGVWSYLISEDKRLHAEIILLFEPRSVLDFGCANGPVMKCTDSYGYPMNGHIIGAGSGWWAGQFERHGLRREIEVKGRAFGSPLARGLYPRASTAEVDPRAKPGAPSAVEKALHGKYDEAMSRIHVARKSFFVFSKAVESKKKNTLLNKLGG